MQLQAVLGVSESTCDTLKGQLREAQLEMGGKLELAQAEHIAKQVSMEKENQMQLSKIRSENDAEGRRRDIMLEVVTGKMQLDFEGRIAAMKTAHENYIHDLKLEHGRKVRAMEEESREALKAANEAGSRLQKEKEETQIEIESLRSRLALVEKKGKDDLCDARNSLREAEKKQRQLQAQLLEMRIALDESESRTKEAVEAVKMGNHEKAKLKEELDQVSKDWRLKMGKSVQSNKLLQSLVEANEAKLEASKALLKSKNAEIRHLIHGLRLKHPDGDLLKIDTSRKENVSNQVTSVASRDLGKAQKIKQSAPRKRGGKIRRKQGTRQDYQRNGSITTGGKASEDAPVLSERLSSDLLQAQVQMQDLIEREHRMLERDVSFEISRPGFHDAEDMRGERVDDALAGLSPEALKNVEDRLISLHERLTSRVQAHKDPSTPQTARLNRSFEI